MRRYPAIALLEFTGIARGVVATDAMIKRAPIKMIKSGTISKGKYLILVGGSVASVEEAYAAGMSAGGTTIVDHVILPDVHPQVHDSILGMRRAITSDALGLIETRTVAAIIRSTDAAVKGANIDVIELRLGDNLGGKAFAIFSGKLEDVQVAMNIVREVSGGREYLISNEIIPRLSTEVSKQLGTSSKFAKVHADVLQDGEL